MTGLQMLDDFACDLPLLVRRDVRRELRTMVSHEGTLCVGLCGIFDAANELLPDFPLSAVVDAGDDGVRTPGLPAQVFGEFLLQLSSDGLDRFAAAGFRPAVGAGSQVSQSELLM